MTPVEPQTIEPQSSEPQSSDILSESLLHCQNLVCERDGRVLFDGLELALQVGEACELLGSNGSGKSTLLRCIAGLYPEFDGAIHCPSSIYFGHRLALNALLSAEENLLWYSALGGVQVQPRDLEDLLERVGLAGYAPVAVAQLSAGQQRRVALARLLLVPASLWLLDEPYTALDTAGQQLVDSLLQNHLASGGAVLCATHQPLGIDNKRTLTLGLQV